MSRGTLETWLYIIFNHEDDEVACSCPQHLRSIFEILCHVPYEPREMDGSPKVITTEFEENIIKISRAIHNSFNIFAHPVTKCKRKLLDIRSYIEQDRKHFMPQDRSMLVDFLPHVDGIIKTVDNAQATKQLSTASIQMLLGIYSYWMEYNLFPKDALADNKITLLDDVDTWMADGA